MTFTSGTKNTELINASMVVSSSDLPRAIFQLSKDKIALSLEQTDRMLQTGNG